MILRPDMSIAKSCATSAAASAHAPPPVGVAGATEQKLTDRRPLHGRRKWRYGTRFFLSNFSRPASECASRVAACEAIIKPAHTAGPQVCSFSARDMLHRRPTMLILNAQRVLPVPLFEKVENSKIQSAEPSKSGIFCAHNLGRPVAVNQTV
jgi:hypothetical protein